MSPQRRLYTVAFPAFIGADAQRIEKLRSRHDPQHAGLLPAHFTLVFGCAAVAERDYLAHVQAAAGNAGPIGFHCRYAMLGADDESEMAYVHLVPDEGHAALSLLHDRLYTGPLAPHLRLDLPYTPHITLGRTADRAQAKAWCDRMNRVGVDLRGVVQALTVGTLEPGGFAQLAEFSLSV